MRKQLYNIGSILTPTNADVMKFFRKTSTRSNVFKQGKLAGQDDLLYVHLQVGYYTIAYPPLRVLGTQTMLT